MDRKKFPFMIRIYPDPNSSHMIMMNNNPPRYSLNSYRIRVIQNALDSYERGLHNGGKRGEKGEEIGIQSGYLRHCLLIPPKLRHIRFDHPPLLSRASHTSSTSYLRFLEYPKSPDLQQIAIPPPSPHLAIFP